jgi:hypothetical protein
MIDIGCDPIKFENETAIQVEKIIMVDIGCDPIQFENMPAIQA